MIEERLGIENRMLRLPEEAGLSHPAEHYGSRHRAVGRIERMAGQLDWRIAETPAVQRGKQRLKPLRMLIKDSEVGRHGSAHVCAAASEINV